jgi:hypothetical protein
MKLKETNLRNRATLLKALFKGCSSKILKYLSEIGKFNKASILWLWNENMKTNNKKQSIIK